MPEDPERWRRHGPMTDPGDQAGRLAGLPGDVGALCGIIHGLLIHADWLSAYGVAEPAAWSRETWPLAERLRQIVAANPGPLPVPRLPGARAVVTCRDFALMLCGMLRQQGRPARLRCGFAAYLGGNAWEDHWICEYFLPAAGGWRVADPQIDAVLAERLGVAFDPAAVPAGQFITAGEAWRRCRSGRDDPAAFGHGAATGLWFVRINVVRDHLALHETPVSAWDGWRRAEPVHRTLSATDLAATDRLALAQEEAPVVPPWLA